MCPDHARVAAASIGSLPLLIFGLLPLLALARGADLAAIDADRLGRTVALALLSTLLAIAIGLPAGLALSRLARAATIARVLLLFPLVTPPVMIAQGWTSALRPGGSIARLIEGYGHDPAAAIEALEGLGGAAFVLATCFAPCVALLVDAAIAGVPRASFDAARSLGASEWTAFRVAAGASLRRALLASACLVFVLAAGECGAPTLLDVDVLGHEVLVHLAAFPDFGASLAAALPLAVLGVLAFELARASMRPTEGRDEAPLSTSPAARSSRAGFAAAGVLGIALLLTVAPPYLAWLADASVSDYPAAFDLAKSPLASTLGSGFVVATFATLCGGLLASAEFSAENAPPLPALRVVHWIAIGLLATPSVLLGLGASALPFLARHSELALIGVLVARHVAVSWFVLAPRVAALQRERIESASALGASRLYVFARIALPSLARPLTAAFLLAFVLAAQDLGATALLHAPGRETFPVALLSIEANSPRGVVAAFAALGAGGLLALGLAAFVVLHRARPPRVDGNRNSLNPRVRSAGLSR